MFLFAFTLLLLLLVRTRANLFSVEFICETFQCWLTFFLLFSHHLSPSPPPSPRPALSLSSFRIISTIGSLSFFCSRTTFLLRLHLHLDPPFFFPPSASPPPLAHFLRTSLRESCGLGGGHGGGRRHAVSVAEEAGDGRRSLRASCCARCSAPSSLGSGSKCARRCGADSAWA